MAQAPATAGTAPITEAPSTVRPTTTPAPGDHPNHSDRADHHRPAILDPLTVAGQQTGSDPSPTEVP